MNAPEHPHLPEPNSLHAEPLPPLVAAVQMRMEKMSPASRRISDYVLSQPGEFMHRPVHEIARVTGVSEPTVLRYCRSFGYRGLPEFRIALAMSLARAQEPAAEYGMSGVQQPVNAARPLPQVMIDPRVEDKRNLHPERKAAIARAAASVLGDARTVLIDSGSTTARFAAELSRATPRTILTTSLDVVDALREATQHTLMLPGGTFRAESRSVTGRLVESTTQHMHFDVGFFGADSISLEHGLSTFHAEEAHADTAMMARCAQVVLLADSSKFGSTALHIIAPIESIHTIVSDDQLPDAVQRAIRERGVELLCAPLGHP